MGGRGGGECQTKNRTVVDFGRVGRGLPDQAHTCIYHRVQLECLSYIIVRVCCPYFGQGGRGGELVFRVISQGSLILNLTLHLLNANVGKLPLVGRDTHSVALQVLD